MSGIQKVTDLGCYVRYTESNRPRLINTKVNHSLCAWQFALQQCSEKMQAQQVIFPYIIALCISVPFKFSTTWHVPKMLTV